MGWGLVAVKDAIGSITPLYDCYAVWGCWPVDFNFCWRRFKNVKKQDIKMGIFVGLFLFLGSAVQTIEHSILQRKTGF